jgi:hypothetical protein
MMAVAAVVVVSFGGSGASVAATCTWNSGWDATPDSADDAVVISSGDLTWGDNGEATTTVASWTQGAAYTGTVTFDTTYAQGFTIAGNATVDGGTWTHKDNGSSITYRLRVDVGGNLTVGAGGAINVDGGDEVGGTKADMPGNHKVNHGVGASHGGAGSTDAQQGTTYGSILKPEALGSASSWDLQRRGGGAVYLTVGGTAQVDGTIEADGYGRRNANGGGSGGSIYIEAASLAGSGAIHANGGEDVWHGSGGGGRVAVILSGAGEGFGMLNGTTPAIEAQGGPAGGGSGTRPGGAAGTVYLETAADGAGGGTVLVDNDYDLAAGDDPVVYTDLPPVNTTDPAIGYFDSEDVSGTDWVIRDFGMVRLTGDVAIGSMTLAGPGPAQALGGGIALDLMEYDLSLYSFTDPDGVPLTTPGAYTDNSSGHFDGVNFNDGSIVILQPPAGPIPEPATMLAALAGAAALGRYLRRRRTGASLPVAMVVVLALAGHAVAATSTWDGGGGDTDWFNAANWNDVTGDGNDDVPTGADNVSIDGAYTVDVTQSGALGKKVAVRGGATLNVNMPNAADFVKFDALQFFTGTVNLKGKGYLAKPSGGTGLPWLYGCDGGGHTGVLNVSEDFNAKIENWQVGLKHNCDFTACIIGSTPNPSGWNYRVDNLSTTKFVFDANGVSPITLTSNIELDADLGSDSDPAEGGYLVVDLTNYVLGDPMKTFTLLDAPASKLAPGEEFLSETFIMGAAILGDNPTIGSATIRYDTDNCDILIDLQAPVVPEPVSALAVVLGIGAIGRYVCRRRS